MSNGKLTRTSQQTVNQQAILSDSIEQYPRATVACFDPTRGELPRRELDVDRLASFMKALEDRGADALLIGASTGHGHLRSVEELADWFSAAAEVDLKKALRIGLLRPEDGVAANERLAGLLRDGNFAVGFVRPGTDLHSKANSAEVADNLRPVVDCLGRASLPIGLYSISDVSGVAMDVDAVARLLDTPFGDHIVAIKVTEASYENSTRRFLDDARLSHLKIVQGWDPHLAQALQDGDRRVGVTSGPMSFAIDQYRHLLAAADRGDWDEVTKSQSAVSELFAAMQDDPTRFADLQRAKFVMGLGHPLLGEIEPDEIGRLLNALALLPREEDRVRLASSLDLMGDGPFHEQLLHWSTKQ